MALVLKDRVRESSTSSGTGSITLAGAYTGYQTFNSVVANGSTVYYTIHNTTSPNDGEWEVGIGTFTAPSTLSRDTVFSSSAGGSKVSFSGSSVLEVFITQPAEQAVYINDATGKVEVFGNGTNTVSFTNINTTNLTANTVTLTAGTITTNASNGTDIANKNYVDGLFSTGISYHAPVRVESPTALSPVTYNNGSSGVGATLTNAGTQTALVIDGVTLSLNDRVLIYTQTDQTQNGIYTVTNVGSGSTNWVLTRATDADSFGLADPNQLGQGDAVFVQQGNTGAGETYVCNTPGTIVFGTTNITFAQISSVQVYSAGTGLNLSNLTFSIANTAVTAATYGNNGAVGQFTVNAQGQITNAANVAINASSITTGTLPNAQTTASSSNGANTIVLRDSTGSFTANTITATTSNATTFNGTTGAFTNVSGNGSAISAINASNISTGTIANARTTANTSNSANTIVARDADGSFGANIVTATFSGNGASLTSINASNISSGTIANARTTAASANGASTIVQRDSGGNFSANTVTAAVIGDLSGGSNINASNISSGTIANARTTASSSNGASTIVLRGASGEFAAGAITGASFSGNGAPLTDINASNISSGTIANARTTAASANGASTIVARDAGGNFAANTITATTFSGSHSGNGSALTDINASNISTGTIANARTTAATANGANTIVLRGASGEFSAGAITGASFTGNGAAISAINASNIATGTIDNARTSASASNGASTIVARDAGGNFAAATITATTFSGAFSGNGSAISAINASNISTGTIDNARTTAASANGASTIVSRDANGSFTANVVNATTFSGAFSGNGSAISAINASNISTGTIANARTTAATANGASTIVLRGTSGEFSAGAITAVSISGNGVALTDINASNISSGTISNARTTAASANGASTIVARDANGSFAGNVITGTTGTFTSVSGNGVALTAINASNITSGTIANARTTASEANGASTIVARDANGSFTANTVTATTFSGGGGSLSAINASNISTGTIANARTTAASANGASTIVTRDSGGNFSANTITANLIGTASSATTATTATTATNQSGGTVSATSITTSGAITANGNANYSYQFAHGNWSRVILPAGNNGASTGDAGLYTWISEPGLTWTGAGIARNRYNLNGSLPRINTTLTGQMIRFGEGVDFYFTSQNTSGTDFSPLTLNGNEATVGTNLYAGGSLVVGQNGAYTAGSLYSDANWGMIIRARTVSPGSAEFMFVNSAGTELSRITSAGTLATNGGFRAESTGPFFLNATTVSANYTIPTNYNAMSAGAITINSGVTVTVSTGSSWVIV